MEGGLSSQVWQAKAYDMRAYISNTKKLVEVHAATEGKLLLKFVVNQRNGTLFEPNTLA
jgi:hypothetical protein